MIVYPFCVIHLCTPYNSAMPQAPTSPVNYHQHYQSATAMRGVIECISGKRKNNVIASIYLFWGEFGLFWSARTDELPLWFLEKEGHSLMSNTPLSNGILSNQVWRMAAMGNRKGAVIVA